MISGRYSATVLSCRLSSWILVYIVDRTILSTYKAERRILIALNHCVDISNTDPIFCALCLASVEPPDNLILAGILSSTTRRASVCSSSSVWTLPCKIFFRLSVSFHCVKDPTSCGARKLLYNDPAQCFSKPFLPSSGTRCAKVLWYSDIKANAHTIA